MVKKCKNVSLLAKVNRGITEKLKGIITKFHLYLCLEINTINRFQMICLEGTLVIVQEPE